MAEACSAEGVPEALQRHVVVWLQVDVEEAWRRVKGSDRPLARDREAFEALLPARLPLYEELADVVLPAGEREMARRGDAVARRRCSVALPDSTRMAWAVTASGGYPIFVGRGLIGAEWPPTEGRGASGSATGRSPTLYLAEHGFEQLPVARVEPGERSKSLAEAERVLRELADAGMTRSDHVVAFGGGVVGDLAGFCAATYQRGVRVSRSRPPWSRRWTRRSAARPGSTSRRQRTTSAPTTSRWPCSPTPRRWRPCPRTSWRRAGSR